MSSPVAVVSAAAVVLAGVAYVTTEPGAGPPRRAAVVVAATPLPVAEQVTIRAVRTKPVVDRTAVYVTVFNNSNVTGLAGRTAARIGGAGWQVVGSDNWYGTIPDTTVYYPPPLEKAGLLLAKDLGVSRVLPASDPMLMDRLTIILTDDLG